MLKVPVAPVTGMVPFRFTPPLKYDHVSVIALKPTGVMTYARGDRSCAQRGETCKTTRPVSNISLTTNLILTAKVLIGTQRIILHGVLMKGRRPAHIRVQRKPRSFSSWATTPASSASAVRLVPCFWHLTCCK